MPDRENGPGDAPDDEPREGAVPAESEPSELPPVTDEDVAGGDVGEVAGGGEITDIGEDSPSS